jgi:DNA gyrase/topoisomerase IV subunit B
MSFTTMAPETRRLICVNQDDENLTEIMFDTLLGDDLPSRKKFIAENSYRYIDAADI